jgi:hypothetical protein
MILERNVHYIVCFSRYYDKFINKKLRKADYYLFKSLLVLGQVLVSED